MKVQNHEVGNRLGQYLYSECTSSLPTKSLSLNREHSIKSSQNRDHESLVTLSDKGKELSLSATSSTALETSFSMETVNFDNRIYTLKQSVEALTGRKIKLLTPLKIDIVAKIQTKNNLFIAKTDKGQESSHTLNNESTVQFSFSGFGLIQTTDTHRLSLNLEVSMDHSYNLTYKMIKENLPSTDF